MDYTSKLPVETLCHVFACARRAIPIPTAEEFDEWAQNNRADSLDPQKRLTYRMAWISATHVCSQWRSVALDNARLWTELPVTLGLDWVQAFVIRSHPAPVSVNWESVREIDKNAPVRKWLQDSLISLYHERMRNFDVEFHRDPDSSTIGQVPWPMLESLALRFNHNPSEPDTFLDRIFPRLLTLKWHGDNHTTAFPWQAPCIRNLTCLSISFGCGMEDAAIGQLLDMLGHMPYLEDLRLRARALNPRQPSTPSAPCSACTSITLTGLASLKVLALSADWATLTHIMGHIAPPSNVRILLCVTALRIREVSSIEMQNLQSVYRQSCAWLATSPTPTPFITADIFETLRSETQICLSRSPIFPRTVRTSKEWDDVIDDIHLDFAMSLQVRNERAYSSIVTSILDDIAPRGLRSLRMEFYSPTSFSPFISDMTHHAIYQDIESLYLDSENAPTCLWYLTNATKPVGSIPLPKLKLVAIRQSWLASIANLVLRGVANGGMKFKSDSLQSFLSARRDAGTLVQRVYIGAAEDARDVRARLVEMGEQLTESETSQLEEAFGALRAMPEVLFISKNADALYEQDSWKRMVRGSA